MNKPIKNTISEDVIYNYLMKAKQIYSSGVKIPQDLFHAVDTLDDIITKERERDVISTPREFNILLKVEKAELAKVLKNEVLVDLIIKNREGKIDVKPGFDGNYGEAILPEKQQKLFQN